MGVKESFQSASLVARIVFVLAILANICNWISFTTTSWYYELAGLNMYRYTGLWRICLDTSLECGQLDGSANEAFAAVQAFAIFGFVSLNVGFLLWVLFMFWRGCNGNSEARIAAAVLFIVSAVTWLISVTVFGAKYYEDRKSFFVDLGFSFGLAVVSLILALVAGVLAIFVGSSSVGQN